MRVLIGAALLAAGCGAVGLAPKAAPTATVKAPAFVLPAQDGTRVAVDGTRDTALVFYRGFW